MSLQEQLALIMKKAHRSLDAANGTLMQETMTLHPPGPIMQPSMQLKRSL